MTRCAYPIAQPQSTKNEQQKIRMNNSSTSIVILFINQIRRRRGTELKLIDRITLFFCLLFSTE